MKSFKKYIEESIENGTLANAKYEIILSEGIPEDEIIQWSKRNLPELIIMGTRGKNQKEVDILGSVTAEVIDSSKFPVLAIPENSTIKINEDIKKVALVTTCDFKDCYFRKLLYKIP